MAKILELKQKLVARDKDLAARNKEVDMLKAENE